MFMKTFLSYVLGVLISLAIIINVFLWYAFDERLYHQEMKKNEVYKIFDGGEPQVNAIVSDVLAYLKGAKKDLSNSYFNDKEIAHMRDVKKLIQKIRLIGYISGITLIIVLLLLLANDRRFFVATMLRGAVITLALMIALAIISSVNFSRFFFQFHTITFSNDFWLLDPGKDTLIKLFPERFFIDMFRRIIAVSGAVAIALLAAFLTARLAMSRRAKRETKSL